MKRTVKASSKAQRSLATRRKIVNAARELFIENGYLSTTIADIALNADVAVQTVYFVFHNKITILRTVLDVAITGDDEPVPVLERPWTRELAECQSPELAARLLTQNACGIVIRAAPVFQALLRSAAEPDVEALLNDNKRLRGESLDGFANILCDAGLLPESNRQHFADVLYALVSEECYMLMVGERGWTDEQWQDWVESMLSAELKKEA